MFYSSREIYTTVYLNLSLLIAYYVRVFQNHVVQNQPMNSNGRKMKSNRLHIRLRDFSWRSRVFVSVCSSDTVHISWIGHCIFIMWWLLKEPFLWSWSQNTTDLSALSSNSTGQLDVFRHDGDTFSVDGTQVGIFEQTDQVCLASLL